MPSVLLKPVPNKVASAFIAAKPIIARQAFDRLLPDLKARAFTITGVESANVMQAVRDRIAELPQGADWDTAKKDIADKISPWLDQGSDDTERSTKRAELLLRTHGFQSYAAAAEEVGDRQRDAFPYCQYVSAGDTDVRDTHAALDGIVLPADSPFWETHTGPWEWGCRCQKIWLTRGDVADMEREDARKAPEARRVVTGARQTALEQDNRLIISRGGGVPQFLNVQPSNTYTFNPKTLKMGADQLRGRYDDETWKTFETWARAQQLDSGSVWDWMNSKATPAAPAAPAAAVPATPPPPPAVVPNPEPKTQNPESARSAPVSAALDVRAVGADKGEIQATIGAIDRVHDDGNLPAVPVVGRVTARNALGTYNFNIRGEAVQIGVRPAGPWPRMTAAHEVGHLLDHQVLGRAGEFASAASAELAGFRSAALQSRAVAAIQQLGAGQRGNFLQVREIWARAYAQYIAKKSGDPVLLAQLDKIRTSRQPWRQWSDEDFAPISAAIDELFRSKGWIKP